MIARRKTTAWVASVAVLAIFGASIANAEELSYSELAARLQALEAQVNSQQAEFASFDLGGGGVQKNADGCGKGACGCVQRSVYATYEFTLLKPNASVPLLNAIAGADMQADYEAGHRFVLGAENSTGIGARLRWWTYDQNIVLPFGGPFNVPIRIDMDTVDGEVTLREDLCSFDLLLSGGIRYARAGFTSQPFANIPALPTLSYEGLGPTVAIEATRNVGSRNLYLVGNFRASQMFGQIAAEGVGSINDELMTIFESQLGVGWSRCGDRASVDARAVWETQTWQNDVFPGTSLGFGGPTFSLTVSR